MIKEIKIGYSCHKEWSKMEGGDSTRHCKSCNKEVFDFSKLSNQEVIDFLSKRRGASTCGKFDHSQIQSINQSLHASHYSSNLKPIILATTLTTMLACGTSKQVYEAQYLENYSNVEIISDVQNPDTASTILLHGRIVDEAQEPLIGANVVVDGTKNGCTTDFDGKFTFEVAKEESNVKTISFHYIGYQHIQVPLFDIKNKEIKVEMLLAGGLLGDMVVVRLPLHRRIWIRFKNLFR